MGPHNGLLWIIIGGSVIAQGAVVFVPLTRVNHIKRCCGLGALAFRVCSRRNDGKNTRGAQGANLRQPGRRCCVL